MPYLFLYGDETVRDLMAPHLTDWAFSRTPVEADYDLVVRWGNESGPYRYPTSLNPVHGIRAARSGRLSRRILSLSGIPIASQISDGDSPPWLVDSRNLRNRYHVGVFDLSVIFFRQDPIFHRAAGGIRSNEVRRLKELAMRSVYSVGLDFGVVHVGLEQKTRDLVVLGVDPAPRLVQSTALRFAGGLKRYVAAMRAVVAKSRNRGLVVGIGADPEFSLARRGGGRAFASDYLPLAGPVGCELQPAHTNGRSHRPIAELRPAYALSPVRLFQNLRSTIEQANQLIPPGIAWRAGSVPDGTFPTGGHIHFSRVPLSTRLLRALDNYLAVPLFLLEDPARAVIRRPRYGFLGDSRVKSHGGFEYRTPFSWLNHPVLARGALCLAYVVVREHLHLARDLFADPAYIEAFYAADKGPFRQRIDELWSDLEMTGTYEAYRRSLADLRQLIDSGWVVDESEDFRRVW